MATGSPHERVAVGTWHFQKHVSYIFANRVPYIVSILKYDVIHVIKVRTQDQPANGLAVRLRQHDDVIKWKHFPRYWPFVRGIHRSPVNSPHKGPVTRSFDVFFDLRLNKWLSKQSWGWWFETPSCSLWRPCNEGNVASGEHIEAWSNTLCRRHFQRTSLNQNTSETWLHQSSFLWIRLFTMTSSNGNIFSATGNLCGEFTGQRWIPCTKASDAELWCFLWYASE